MDPRVCAASLRSLLPPWDDEVEVFRLTSKVCDRRFHIAFVAAALVHQISFILRLFDTIV
ncbi:hypothetical protein NKH36_00195 [Mesorhizobium sp. M1312]|uniref:hypothetical protein n=1 Tax=unclassified Mesorhizobium TaxID=325217 RepID=UPI00333CA20C